MTKLPPFGKSLAERQRFNNSPFFVVVCVGMNAWERAKAWSAGPNDTPGLVLTHDTKPENLYWPVNGCLVVVDWDTGPDETLIIELVQVLLSASAKTVTVRPLFVDHKEPIQELDPISKKLKHVREYIRQYFTEESCRVA